MAVGKVNIGSGGGGKLNIFTQLSEPKTKEGIWIKTDRLKKEVINDNQLYFANAWITDTSLLPSPPYSYVFSSAIVSVGNDIYLFSGGYLSKFNRLENTWTVIGSAPFGTSACYAFYYNGEIYVFSATGSYKYNILNNTWSGIASPTQPHYKGYNVIIGSKIYASYGSPSDIGTQSNYLEEYDIPTNTWKTLISTGAGRSACGIAYGNGFFMLGGNTTSVDTEKRFRYYDVSTNTITDKGTLPVLGSNVTGIVVGDTLYVMPYSDGRFYKYDIKGNVWTQLPGLGATTTFKEAVMVGDRMYIISSLKMYIFSFTAKVYEEGSCVLTRSSDKSGKYMTELVSLSKPIEGQFPRLLSCFDDIWMYYDGNLQTLPTYYGDGTKWMKFKN
ncbi:hypothetical protein [Bacillus sp. REN10]|uniref:Kelch repeat-containing protein n=1 Tax=Bacillus sp. REN10 TaxID=2782541 RepID=UPI00193B3861|nr:hypothetical protein [Bacillus sp. REN10]